MALKIIGAGMGRTGTASLKVALEALGMGRCYHMSEVLKNPEFIQGWISAAEGEADWDTIFSGYSATVHVDCSAIIPPHRTGDPGGAVAATAFRCCV
jgi:hypothetical protein